MMLASKSGFLLSLRSKFSTHVNKNQLFAKYNDNMVAKGFKNENTVSQVANIIVANVKKV